MISFIEGQWSHYPTLKVFMIVLYLIYANLKNADIGFISGLAIIVLIKDLSSELTFWVTVKQQSMQIVKEIKDKDFYKYCSEAISEAC